MNLSYNELLELLKREDEVSLLEMLEIYPEDIVDRFPDKIEAKLDKLRAEYEEELEASED